MLYGLIHPTGYHVLCFLSEFQILSQPLFQQTGHNLNHTTWAVIPVVSIKGFIVAFAIRILHIDRWIACLHQHKIQNQTPSSSIAIHKRMDSFKFQVEQCCTLNRMQLLVSSKRNNQLLHLFRNQNRIGRRMICTHNSYWNFAINATVFWPIHQHQSVNLPDDPFRKRNSILHQFLYIQKSISMAHGFQVVFQRLFVDGNPFKNQCRFLECQSISLNGIGMIGILNQKFLSQSFQFALRQRTATIQLCFQCIDPGELFRIGAIVPTIAGAVPIQWFLGICRNSPRSTLPDSTIYLSFFTQNTDSSVRNTPLFRNLRWGFVIHDYHHHVPLLEIV